MNYGADLIVSPDGRRVYFVPQYDQTVSVINTIPPVPTTTRSSPRRMWYGGVGDVKIAPDGTRLYMSADAFGLSGSSTPANLAVVQP